MGYLDDLIAEREDRIARGEIPAPLPYKPHKDFGFAAAYDQAQRRIAEQEAWDSFVGKPQPVRVDENGVPIEQPQTDDGSWGVTRGLLSGGAGVLQGQAQLANLAGIGDGAAADYFGKIMQKNARKKEYTIGDMLPFASDYWTNGEGAAYDVGNMLGSSIVLGSETAAAAATGGAALGALGVGSEAAAAAAALGKSATAARAAFMTDAVVNGMGRAAAKMGMHKLEKVLTGPMGKLYAANILKTPLEASSEAGNAGAEALANGASLSDAQRQALIVGGLQMPLLALSNTMESAGLGGLFLKEAEEATGKKLGKEGFLSILGNITREGMQNAWEEGMQQSTHEYAAGKQNLLGVVNPLQWSDEAAQQAAVGAVGGAVIGGGNAGMRAYVTREQTETAPANTTAEPTPAQQAREYLDTIGQQEDKFTPEQIATLREVAENGDDETVVNTATQFGWQAPGAQQQKQEQQAQPAPVTPASTPEEQIQTATNAVNAATANVVNGGEVINNGGEQGNAPVQQPTQVASGTADLTPVVQSISSGSKSNYPTVQAPTFGVAENPLGQDKVNIWLGSLQRTMNDKLSKGNKTRKYLNDDGSINVRTLRAAPALRRWLDENPTAVDNLKAALSGNQDAMKWVSKLSPTRQAAAFDALENGLEEWKVTDEDRQNFAKYDYYQGVKKIKSQLYDKAKNLKGNERIALYSLLKNGSNNKILEAAKKYGINVPKEVSKYKPNNTPSAGVSNINSIIEDILNGNNQNASEPVETAAATPNSDIVETATPDNGGTVSTTTTTAQPVSSTATTTASSNGSKTENKKLPTIAFAGIKTVPRISSDGKYIGFKLPEGATLSKQELDDFKAAGFAYRDDLKANIAEDTEKSRAFLAKYAAEKDNNNGGNINAANTNGTRENGSDKGSENPVQDNQSQEPVKGETNDNQGDGEDGEVEVTTPAESNTDANGITAIPYDADKSTVEKLQKANTKIIMEKVNSIDKQYDDGKLSADEARKAISEFFQKYSQSKATHKVYEDGTEDKVSAIRKNITKKADAARRNAKKAEAEAANKAKKEAEEKRKKEYADDFQKASGEADKILERHKNEEISLAEAESELDGLTEGLERKLEARGDKLKVKDKEQLYTRRHNQLKRQQDELDKKIYESAVVQSMADSEKKLNEDGLKVFAWVKRELSNDPKKRFKEEAINAAAAMVAFRAQTWTSLFNKYCGTNYTPLEYAQRYPFYLYDDNIPGQSESVRGLTTRSRDLTKGGKIEFAGNAKTLEIFHELAHTFFADFVHIAEAPDAPKRLKDDLRRLREWIGEVDPANKDLETPYFYSKQEFEEYSPEERLAQAMVKHVAAADTPIEWLNNMFKEFAQKLLETIQYWDERLREALAKPEATDETRRYAKAYTFDFDIPADVKRIINEMIYYDEGAHKEVTYDTQLEDLEAINKEVNSTFNEDAIPSPKVINDFKRRIAAAGRWKKEYTDEQKAVLEAATKVASKNLELAAMEQSARLAFDKTESGDKSESTLANAASGLLNGNPEEMEEMPEEALTVLENALNDQQIEDIRDFGRENLAQAVLSDYAVSGKLDDDYKEFVDDLREDDIEESKIKAVEKYAGLILDSVKKYKPLYDKRKELEDAQKVLNGALEKVKAAEQLKNYIKKGGKDDTSAKALKTPEELRKGKFGEAMYQAAWHGTPHIIEGNLTTERIGSGEGAIIHGWGLYFAKNRKISATRYRDRLLLESDEPIFKGKIVFTDPKSGKTEIYYAKGEEFSHFYENSSAINSSLYALWQTKEEANLNIPKAINYLRDELSDAQWQLEKAKEKKAGTAEEFAAWERRARADIMSELQWQKNKPFNLNGSSGVSPATIRMLNAIRPLTQEEVNQKIQEAQDEVDKSKSALFVMENSDFSNLKLAGELLEVEIPENNVLLDEQQTFENQPIKVREALKRIFEKLPDAKFTLNGKTGKSIYQALGVILNGGKEKSFVYCDLSGRMELEFAAAKKASMALRQQGLKGIHYNGYTDGECFVIFDDDAIAIKQRYDAALRKHQEEIQRSRNEVVDKIKSMFSGSKFEEQENGDLLITTKGGNKILYKITDRILLNDAEAQEARKAHGIADDAEVSAEGRYRTVYEGDIDAMVEVGLDSRKNTEAHETTHAVINLALGKEGSKVLFDRAEKLIKEYGLKADAEEVACDAVRDFITARENGFITTFTASERAELGKNFWGRMMLRANEMGAKAKVLSDKNEAELSKTAWGKMLLAKLKLQRNLAKLLSKIYDFYKKFRAVRDANENFHNLARKIELGEVWNEKSGKNNGTTTQYSARPRTGKDFTISSINLKYKKELEQAFERNANAGDITAIQNRHQEELAQYLKDKGEKQKEKAKLRAAELRELRKKLKAGEIDSFEMAGGRVTLDKDGKEKFESIQDPNELPSFVYKNSQHNDEAYKNATATQKLNASIKRPEEKGVIQSTKDWLKDAKDKFYKQWVDKYDALGILDKAIAKKGGKPADDSMTILSQMQMITNYATGAARALVEGDENSLKPLAQKWGIKGNTSLGMMMEKLEADHKSGKYKDYIKKSSINGGTGAQDYVNALENYLTALTLWESAQNHKLDYDREVAEWQKKGARGEKPKETPYKFPNNLTEDDIKQIIRSAPAEFKGYQKMFKSVTDDLLNIMLKSGLITLDRYDTLKDRYKFYCPLYRDFSDTAAVDDLVTQINAGRGLGNVSAPLKSRSSEGSFRDVSAPLTNAVKSISAICAKAERNRVGQYAVKEAKKHKLDEFIREVKGNAGDAKNCIFTVMFNGEKHAYQTVPELYPAITAAVEPLCKIQMAVLTKPAQLLRAGSTMSPSFIIRNFLRDTIFAAVSSKNGFIPIYDSIRGGYAYLKNKQLRGEYDAAGVVSSNYYSDNEAVTKSLNEMAGGKTWQEMTPLDIAKAFVKKPVAGLEWLSELIENSTRMGEFMKARAKGKSIEQAGHDAVEVSLNFNRSGATGQQINRMVPFFNACIQGGDKMYRLFKANPRDTALKIATFIVLPSLALWVYNHDEDWYKDIDPNIKMTNWILPGGVRIPKPQEAGILFGSGVEAMLDTANGQDPKAMKEWRHNVIEALTPGFLPTVILPIIEWMANYSFFRDKPVVSQALQRLPDEMQYGPYTSETAKGIGSITGLSPVKIDNLWRGYTGTMGMFLFQAPDRFAAEKQNLPEKKVSEMTVVRDFIVNDMNMNRTMNEFYELKNAATQKHAGYGKKGKPSAEVAGVNIAAQSIQKLQKEAREITASSKYNSAQKRVLIDKLQAKQKKIAQACIKKYGSKFDY